MSAPLDTDALQATLRPHGESVMLPAAAYADEAVFRWEQWHFFAGSWTCIGRVDELAAEGTQQALTIGDVGIVLTFPSDSEPRAFANVCRHRGHELLSDGTKNSRPALVCPYHGWSYQLDGAVKAAPRMGDDFDSSAKEGKHWGLVELPLEVWHGWAFVNALGTSASDSAESKSTFADHIGELDGIVSPYGPENLELGARHTYEVKANWKIIVENYHECYHCPLIHPELCKVSPPTSGDNWDLPGDWIGGTMELRPDAETMSLDGRSAGAFIPGIDRRTVAYVGLFPNLLLSMHPDYVMTHRLEPSGFDRTTIECSWYFMPGVRDTSYAVDFWDITNREDWAACESVQRGASSPHFRPGPLAPAEDAVYQWVTLIARGYLQSFRL